MDDARRPNRRNAQCLTLVLLAVAGWAPSVQAASPISLSASEVAAHDIDAVHAELVALIHSAGTTDEAATLQFRLEAENLLVEIDQVEGSTDAAGAQVGGDADTRTSFHRDAILVQTEVRDRHELTVFAIAGEPAPRIQAGEVSCLAVRENPTGRAAANAHVDAGREPPSVDLRRALTTSLDCADGIWILGSFHLSLWDWDVQVRSHGATTSYRTGEFRDEGVSEPTGNVRGVHPVSRYQAFLSVYNGTLHLDRLDSKFTDLYLDDLLLAGAQKIALGDPLGQLARHRFAEAEVDQLLLYGDMEANLRAASESRIDLSDLAGVERLRIDASPASAIGPQGAYIGPGSDKAWIITPVLLTLGLGLLALRTLRRQTAHGRGQQSPSTVGCRRRKAGQSTILFRRATRHYHRRRLLRARLALTTHQLIRPNCLPGPALRLRALLHREQGRLEEALFDHDRAHHRFTSSQLIDLGENAFEASRTAALLGRKDASLRWLEISVRVDRSFMARADGEPDYGGVWEDERFQERLHVLRAVAGGMGA